MLGNEDLYQWVQAAKAGDVPAKHKLLDHLYVHLHSQAYSLLRAERKYHTLSASDLLHEGMMKILEDEVFAKANGIGLIYVATATAMERVLAEHARKRRTLKRGGNIQRLPIDEVLDELVVQSHSMGLEVEELRKHMKLLEAKSPRHKRACDALRLNRYEEMSHSRIAVELGVSDRTIEDDLKYIMAELRVRLEGSRSRSAKGGLFSR